MRFFIKKFRCIATAAPPGWGIFKELDNSEVWFCRSYQCYQNAKRALQMARSDLSLMDEYCRVITKDNESFFMQPGFDEIRKYTIL